MCHFIILKDSHLHCSYIQNALDTRLSVYIRGMPATKFYRCDYYNYIQMNGYDKKMENFLFLCPALPLASWVILAKSLNSPVPQLLVCNLGNWDSVSLMSPSVMV